MLLCPNKIEIKIHSKRGYRRMNSTKEKEDEYVLSLRDKEKVGYEIAKSHLGSAFQLNKSVGYLRWLSLPSTDEKKC
jgi:hypothetical protein